MDLMILNLGLVKFLSLCVAIISAKEGERRNELEKNVWRKVWNFHYLNDCFFVVSTYLYSEYASMIPSWIAVATRKDVRLKQVTLGHPVCACGVETLRKRRNAKSVVPYLTVCRVRIHTYFEWTLVMPCLIWFKPSLISPIIDCTS